MASNFTASLELQVYAGNYIGVPASVPFPCYEGWQFESNCADDVLFRVVVG